MTHSLDTIIHFPPLASVHPIGDPILGCNVSLTNEFTIVASSSSSAHAINMTYAIEVFVTLLPDGDNVVFLDEGRSISNGTSRQKITTVSTRDGPDIGESIWLKRVSLSQYDIYANTKDKSDNKTFDLGANITWSRERFEVYTAKGLHLNLHWVNSIEASGRYNRSLTNHSDINLAEGHSNETFSVSTITSSNMNRCYNARASAINGSVIVNEKKDDKQSLSGCHFPPRAFSFVVTNVVGYWTLNQGFDKCR